MRRANPRLPPDLPTAGGKPTGKRSPLHRLRGQLRPHWTPSGDDLSFDKDTGANGSLPWALLPGESATVFVDYAPSDTGSDLGTVTVISENPDEPLVTSTVVGRGKDSESWWTTPR